MRDYIGEVSVVSQNSALHKYVIAAILVLEVEDFGEGEQSSISLWRSKLSSFPLTGGKAS
jgi:hypothetical protein